MGKHHRKWFLEEPIASNKKEDNRMGDLEDYWEEVNEFTFKEEK